MLRMLGKEYIAERSKTWVFMDTCLAGWALFMLRT